ncbi:MAG: hypothetical protein N2508_02440 [Anaerolineae bacterium]|nr:hypothetical protein [Anaerolineae bacterium]
MQHRTLVAGLLAGLLIPMLLVVTMPVSAQAPGVRLAITPYLGGHVKYGEWLPLRVSLSNAGSDLDTEVRAEIAGSSGTAVYALPVPLPAGARKEITLHVLPSNFTREIVVHLVDSQEQVLAEAKTTISTHPQNEYLIGVIAPDEGALAMLKGLSLPERSDIRLIPLSLEDLPERIEALRSLDCLILAGVDTSSLTPSQGNALFGWVQLGGRLFVGGGAGARRVLAGLPESLRLVSLGETVELINLSGLAEFAGRPVLVPGPFLATLPADYHGRALIRQDSNVLLVQEYVGEGWVAYLALDPTVTPFDAWAGLLPFWQKLLETDAVLPPNAPVDIPRRNLEAEQMWNVLTNLPTLELPSIRWLAGLLALYIILVGPVNYLLLRRWRRLDWGWITVPALTLIFSVGSYGLGLSQRGSDVVINEISVIPLSPGSQFLEMRSYVGLFSPGEREYTVQVNDNGLVSPLVPFYAPWGPAPPGSPGGYSGPVAPINVLQGNPTLVRKLGVSQWAMRAFQVESWIPAEAAAFDADLKVEENRLYGTVRNGLECPIQAMLLLSGQRFAHLEGMAPGEERVISATLQSASYEYAYFPWAAFEQFHQGPQPPSREVMVRQSILEAYLHTNWGPAAPLPAPTLFVWAECSPLDVQVVGVRATELQKAMLVVSLPPQSADGEIYLPPGTIPGRLVESVGSAGECGPGTQVFVAVGQVTLKYRLPSALRGLDLTALSVYPSSNEPQMTVEAASAPELSLYDWTKGEWTRLEGVKVGSEYKVADPDRFLNPVGGTISLRVQRNSMSGLCYKFEIALRGRLPEEVAGE